MAESSKSRMAIADNVFVRMMYLIKAGDTVQGHAHTFDHITLISRGSVKMEHDNGSAEYAAPALVITPKDIHHKFTALEDKTVLCCIHAVRDGDDVDDVAPQDITKEQALELVAKYPLIK